MNILKLNNKKIFSLIVLLLAFVLVFSKFLFSQKTIQDDLCGVVYSNEIEVISLETAKVDKLCHKENDVVKTNDLLVILDSSLIDNKIKQLESNIDYETTKLNFIKAKEEKILEEYLNFKKDKTKDVKEINAQLKILEEIQQQNVLEQKKILTFEKQISYLNEKKKSFFIYSPCDGLVKNIKVKENQNISSKEKLLTISDLQNVWVLTRVYLNKSSDVEIGDNFDIVIENFPTSKYEGKVFYISDIQKDKDSKFVDLKLSVNQIKQTPNEPTNFLNSGMKAQIYYE